jgi:hypothetical protein
LGSLALLKEPFGPTGVNVYPFIIYLADVRGLERIRYALETCTFGRIVVIPGSAMAESKSR